MFSLIIDARFRFLEMILAYRIVDFIDYRCALFHFAADFGR